MNNSEGGATSGLADIDKSPRGDSVLTGPYKTTTGNLHGVKFGGSNK